MRCQLQRRFVWQTRLGEVVRRIKKPDRALPLRRAQKLATLPFGHPRATSRNARVEFGVG